MASPAIGRPGPSQECGSVPAISEVGHSPEGPPASQGRRDARRPSPGTRAIAALALGGSALLAGCSTLLPSSRTGVMSEWGSYEEAVKALATSVPYTATRQNVHDQGLDPSRNPAITVLHFADVLQRFASATLIRQSDVDPGIRDCLHAGKRCSGYAITVEKLHRQRIGNFWVDSLNFRRETVTTGWRVDVLMIFVDDVLVYQLVGGRPTINEVDVKRNPLGPLQGWGEHTVPVPR